MRTESELKQLLNNEMLSNPRRYFPRAYWRQRWSEKWLHHYISLTVWPTRLLQDARKKKLKKWLTCTGVRQLAGCFRTHVWNTEMEVTRTSSTEIREMAFVHKDDRFQMEQGDVCTGGGGQSEWPNVHCCCCCPTPYLTSPQCRSSRVTFVGPLGFEEDIEDHLLTNERRLL